MATDPFRYFRIEARELVDGLGQAALGFEKGRCDPAEVARMLRLAHTLKGAARVVRQLEIANLAHQVEEVLAPLRDTPESTVHMSAEPLLALIDALGHMVAALGEPAPASAVAPSRPSLAGGSGPIAPGALAAQFGPGPAAPQDSGPSATTALNVADEAFQTVRVDVAEMDQLMAALTATGAELAALRKQVAELQGAAHGALALANRLQQKALVTELSLATEQEMARDVHRQVERLGQDLLGRMGRLGHELDNARQGADRLRLIPVHTVAMPLSRAVRDAARSLGKEVDFELEGGGLRLDSKVLMPLKDALGHVVRNAVAHGIEAAAERRRLGKPPRGTVRVTVASRGRFLVCVCSDDGAGIDEAAVRRTMVERGVFDGALSRDEVFQWMLSSRVSTSSQVSQIAGRGIGLDVVRETALRLGGEVTLGSEPGKGASVTFRVPLSLASIPVLLVEAGRNSMAIPLDAVVEAKRFGPEEIHAGPEGATVEIGGKMTSFRPLAQALRLEALGGSRGAVSSVLLHAEGKTAAFGVDGLRGTREIVVRPVPQGLAADSSVLGIHSDSGGRPCLVLDPVALVKLADAGWSQYATEEKRRARVLVVDDSLTTRMLEQSILETAGYAVDLATSGEQGLEKARDGQYAIFLVDVDMPGMSGFEFVERTRSDPELRKVPAILVTSRDSQEDLARGRRAGAGDYVVKGEFDQGRLLQSIERLLGS